MDRIEEIGGTLITHRDPGHFGGIVIARLYDDLDVDRMILKSFMHAEFSSHRGLLILSADSGFPASISTMRKISTQ